MKFEELVLTRESCRSYGETPVSREDIVKIVDAGRYTQSACNSQPWKFIVVDEDEAKARLLDALTLDDGATGVRWSGSPSAYVIFVEEKAKVFPIVEEYYGDTQRFASGDIGAACMSMCFQAADLGIGSCVIGLSNEKKMEKLFNIPDGKMVRFVLGLGYPKEKKAPGKKARKKFEDTVCFNEYQ